MTLPSSELQSRILAGMTTYMAESDVGYTQADVDRCGAILDEYLTALQAPSLRGQEDEIMAAVKHAVLQLNELNESTEGGMIETGEREALWELIQTAAVAAGLVTTEDDITEEWREW